MSSKVNLPEVVYVSQSINEQLSSLANATTDAGLEAAGNGLINALTRRNHGFYFFELEILEKLVAKLTAPETITKHYAEVDESGNGKLVTKTITVEQGRSILEEIFREIHKAHSSLPTSVDVRPGYRRLTDEEYQRISNKQTALPADVQAFVYKNLEKVKVERKD